MRAGLGKDPVKSMNMVMSYWLLNAMRTVAGPKSSRAQITAYMMRKIRDTPLPASRRKRAAVVDEMRNTMAMLIAAKKNIKGFRQAKGSQGYKIARGIRNAASFSSGYLRFGFMEGLKARQTRGEGQMPRYRKPAGSSPPPQITEDQIRMEVTNFASVIGELFPNAFEVGAIELLGRLNAIILADMIKAQNAAGLTAKST